MATAQPNKHDQKDDKEFIETPRGETQHKTDNGDNKVNASCGSQELVNKCCASGEEQASAPFSTQTATVSVIEPMLGSISLIHNEPSTGDASVISTPRISGNKDQTTIATTNSEETLHRRLAVTCTSTGSASAKSLCASAPLAHKRVGRVGGVPITKKRRAPRSKEEVQREKMIRSAQREAERADRQLEGKTSASVKHKEKDRDMNWALRRIHQSRRVTSLFTCNDSYVRSGLITEDQACTVDNLCQAAAFEAAKTPNSRHLPTGCPALWTIALVQRVWAINNHGWVVETESAREKLSFAHMHDVCLSAQGDTTAMPEVNTNSEIEMLKTSKQKKQGVIRKFPSHSFGSQEQIEAKLSCLDDLLKASGNEGLGEDIKRTLPPAIYSKPKPPKHFSAQVRANCIANHANFGRKSNKE